MPPRQLLCCMDYEVCARTGRIGARRSPSLHRDREFHRGHQSQCGVFTGRRRPRSLRRTESPSGLDAQWSVVCRPSSSPRAGTGIGVAYSPDLRQRAGRFDGPASASGSATRQHTLCGAPGLREGAGIEVSGASGRQVCARISLDVAAADPAVPRRPKLDIVTIASVNIPRLTAAYRAKRTR